MTARADRRQERVSGKAMTPSDGSTSGQNGSETGSGDAGSTTKTKASNGAATQGGGSSSSDSSADTNSNSTTSGQGEPSQGGDAFA
ncbi:MULTISPECIES: hypothetical protein [Rhizobium]|uniref:hypothetical protein n=1 Tax=Rhizobium TaxID=379 RepID=UPI001147639B|nr:MULTISPECIES: hypothetical protein [Rhizobium]MCS0463572.1 hypothetical protein [Rhizobium favelukesii]UFS84065.1 hypothetical protein LPB79_18055 [Rhizobium sp. T136]